MSAGYTGVFTGRQYPTARSTGYAEWSPKGDYRALLDAAHGVLSTLAADDLVPVGPRAVGYRLHGHQVGSRTVIKKRDDLPAGERGDIFDFSHVGDVLNRGRRARLIPWEWVSDNGMASYVPGGFRDANELADHIANFIDTAPPDLTADQPRRVEVWCEAVDLMQLTARITREYGVPTFSARGWGGPVPARDAGERWSSGERPVVLLYLGDYDPDGLMLAERNIADALAFNAGSTKVHVQRIGVSPDQVERWGIPHEPGKTSHRGGLDLPMTVQAEAIPPAKLRELLTTEITSALDMAALRVTREQWKTERRLVSVTVATE